MSDHPRPHPDLAGYVLGVLEPSEAVAFDEHLQDCLACRAEVSALAAMPSLLEQAAPPSTPPPALRHRTLDAVEREAVRSRRRRFTTGALAVAATAAVVVFLVVGPLMRDPFAIDLVAPGGGGAAGVAYVTQADNGLRIDMQLRDLPPAPPDTHYECWYVGEDDGTDAPERISGGTFVAPEGGDVDVTMFTAADPAKYPAMDVTLEPDDGNPARTGAVILASR